MTIRLAHNTFSIEDINAFEPAMKIGLLATINPAGLPHLTLISSLKAGSPHDGHLGAVHRGTKQAACPPEPAHGLSWS